MSEADSGSVEQLSRITNRYTAMFLVATVATFGLAYREGVLTVAGEPAGPPAIAVGALVGVVLAYVGWRDFATSGSRRGDAVTAVVMSVLSVVAVRYVPGRQLLFGVAVVFASATVTWLLLLGLGPPTRAS
ncbi:hypothetical protein C475_02633 [Halosimplex carlsbadense 2-9-1]|uniref:Uncharacterized protein n=1 Tax=Halosimplex carlsbadense 2-9-1 TaxID=797114 RepID=M0D5V2_9EURY|nr:hypothetical protein [Halosimplex carlsbadense]ELZ29509.1 hypothetical protein C475_02633 [Halosimplex carlsbadense 2-9-1]